MLKRLGVLVLVAVGAGLGVTGIAEAATNDGKVGIRTNVRNELHTLDSGWRRLMTLCPVTRSQAQTTVWNADAKGYTYYPCTHPTEGLVRVIGSM